MTRTYLRVWVALMVLLGLTVGASYLPLGAWGTALSMAIAGVKALLVGIFYRHLGESEARVRFFSVASLAWLAAMFGLTLTDLFSRAF